QGDIDHLQTALQRPLFDAERLYALVRDHHQGPEQTPGAQQRGAGGDPVSAAAVNQWVQPAQPSRGGGESLVLVETVQPRLQQIDRRLGSKGGLDRAQQLSAYRLRDAGSSSTWPNN